MAFTKELSSTDQHSDYAYRPLALGSWDMTFDSNGNIADDSFTGDRMSSYQLALHTAENAVKGPESPAQFTADMALRDAAFRGLMASIADQAHRNGRYATAATRDHLAEQYSHDYQQIMYGTASQSQLARTVLENDQYITSLEVARHTHAAQWEYGHNINQDVRAELFSQSDLEAVALRDEPRFKIKSFPDRAIFVERKRHVAELMGGKAILVMRLMFLLDDQAHQMPQEIRRHIKKERSKQKQRAEVGYDFEAENKLLRSMLDDRYIRAPIGDNKPDFIIPLQTGYYVYSPEAHEREKQAAAAEEARLKAAAPVVRKFWRQFGSEPDAE